MGSKAKLGLLLTTEVGRPMSFKKSEILFSPHRDMVHLVTRFTVSRTMSSAGSTGRRLWGGGVGLRPELCVGAKPPGPSDSSEDLEWYLDISFAECRPGWGLLLEVWPADLAGVLRGALRLGLADA